MGRGREPAAPPADLEAAVAEAPWQEDAESVSSVDVEAPVPEAAPEPPAPGVAAFDAAALEALMHVAEPPATARTPQARFAFEWLDGPPADGSATAQAGAEAVTDVNFGVSAGAQEAEAPSEGEAAVADAGAPVEAPRRVAAPGGCARRKPMTTRAWTRRPKRAMHLRHCEACVCANRLNHNTNRRVACCGRMVS
ncbi:MAG: hypothetical protein M5R40_02650 [Anaerolineae bacterium]|nr:hypothetical protein [Anaerolineae bacterium]